MIFSVKIKILLGVILIAFLFLEANFINAQQFDFTKDTLNLGIINPDLIRAYNDIKISDSWDITETLISNFQKSIKIGIIDSGIDDKHPEFRNINFGNTPFSARFDHDSLGHGTQTSGIIGANNISAFSPTNYIQPQMNGIISGIKNLNYIIEHRYDGGPNLFKVLFHIFELAAVERVDIVNISSTANHSTCNAILLNSAESIFFAAIAPHVHTLFVTSAGETLPNVSDAECFLPGALGNNLSNVINVGGLDLDINKRWPNSPFGKAINITAPAVNVYSPAPNNQYDRFFGGTSASAPLVTGVAGILKAIKPELTPGEIKDILQKSADPINTGELFKPLGSGCFDPNNNPQGFNGCRLNAFKAVCKVLNCKLSSPLIANLPLGHITTVAGNGIFGSSGDGGPAISASLFPIGIALDNFGNLYVSDFLHHRIRKINASTKIINTIIGTGIPGLSGDNELAKLANISHPNGIAVDNEGDIFFADQGNHRIRKVDALTKIITTLVVGLNQPTGVAVDMRKIAMDNSGNIYIADRDNHRIIKVNASTGLVTVIAGTGTPGFSNDDGLAIFAQLKHPAGLTLDKEGNIYIADTNNHRVRKIDGTTGIITTVAGNGVSRFSECGADVGGFDGDGKLAIESQLNFPSDVAVDDNGNIFISDTFNYRIRRVDVVTKVITTTAGIGGTTIPLGIGCSDLFRSHPFSGDNGPAVFSALSRVEHIVLDNSGNLFLADRDNFRVRAVRLVP